MSIEEISKRLKDMVVEDDINGIIDLCRKSLSILNGHITEAELLQYAARLNSIDREKNLGIITTERYSIERNQLRQILIEKITQLRKGEKVKNTREPEIKANDGDLLIEAAANHFREEEYSQAAELLQSAVNKRFVKYSQAEAYSRLGNVYNKLNYYQDAIDAYQKALELNPESASFWTNLGIVYRLTGQYDKAEGCYQKALAIDPDYPQLYTSLGALHVTHTMKFHEAIVYLKKAIKLDPSQAVAYANMAIAKASVGKFAEADSFLKKAIMKGYKNGKNAKRIIDNLKEL